MAKRKKQQVNLDFAFYEWLWEYYTHNRGKIRSRYNLLTKKFLDYNDLDKNPDAFLRRPQFEALEMYVFIKEFLDNMQVAEMFRQWVAREGDFSDSSYYSIHKDGNLRLIDIGEEQNKYLFDQMKSYQESYPNYIYALTMGLGKTILMATCIFYEFLLARQYPKDERYCHNALVFAPDKTVRQSLREIETFDKSNVVPPEYVNILNSNINFHFLDDNNMQLHTIDFSEFNIIITNNQKIIVKKKRKPLTLAEKVYISPLLGNLFEDEEDDSSAVWDDTSLMDNQRFQKLCRLPQLGVYVDEAHHLFGADLEKSLRLDKKDDPDAGKTSLRCTINMLAKATNVVACYNYTGTPYVGGQVLPEVVYSCPLRTAIHSHYLKEAEPHGYDNVKDEEFLRRVVKDFFAHYGGQKFEYLNPKMAIYAASVDEAVKTIRPALESILADLGYDTDTILVNVGDQKYTKDADIKLFNELDVVGSEGDKKQFIILVGKGKEGWNCRSLFAVAMFREPDKKATNFVLQATMRCMRQITDTQQKAQIYLSKKNLDTLSVELRENCCMNIEDLNDPKSTPKRRCEVRVVPPEKKIKLCFISRTYMCTELSPAEPIDFKLSVLDTEKYKSNEYTMSSITEGVSIRKKNADDMKIQVRYSKIMLVSELSRYLNLPCLKLSKILDNSVDGIAKVLAYVNAYNEIIDDVIIPCIFNYLYKIEPIVERTEREVTLLKIPEDPDYYEFHAKDELIVTNKSRDFTEEQVKKSFHADTYCFDSKPERELFYQYINNIKSGRVKEIYFTGMFTSSHSDFAVHYYDPESGRLRRYYPDFLAKMDDDTYQIIEVKQDNMIEDSVVIAKKTAAEQIASANKMKYIMFPGKVVIDLDIFKDVSFDLSPTEMSALRDRIISGPDINQKPII